jgi:hypothetical protein
MKKETKFNIWYVFVAIWGVIKVPGGLNHSAASS